MSKNAYSYSVVLTPAEEGGYTVTVPALHGCITEGDTFEEAMRNAREVVELCVEDMLAHGETLPVEVAPAIASTIVVSENMLAHA